MSSDTTITAEMNKVIAIFAEIWERHSPIESRMPNDLWCSYLAERDELKYHVSWEWLMPVVRKLKECFKETVITHYDITHMHNNGINFQLSIVNIDSAHLAVYHAIQWYNQNKKQ